MRVTSWLRRHWKAASLTGLVVVVILAVGIPYLYIHVIEGSAPPPLALGTPAATEGPATDSVGGTYQVASGSQAGYRVNEVLAGQHATAVGRTSHVTGSMTLAGDRVTAASFTVDMATVTSDRSQRDNQFRGRIMDVADHPTGGFTLTKPMTLSTIPAVGKPITAHATGNLTLHGTTRPVTLTLTAERTAAGIEVSGTTTIRYGDFGIDNPSFGGFVSVGDSGAFEVLLMLHHVNG